MDGGCSVMNLSREELPVNDTMGSQVSWVIILSWVADRKVRMLLEKAGGV